MIALIVAMDQNGVIGHNGTLPWHYKEDLKYFKETTLNHPVLMGRVTYESILKSLGKPLPSRTNIVVSNTLDDDRVEIVRDLDAYLDALNASVFVIGGATIYASTLPYADRLYITYIDHAYQGDTFFPEWDKTAFTVIKDHTRGPLRFVVYERISHD